MNTQEQIDFILGPQAPIVDSWFDRTEIARGKFHGEACPAAPPDPANLDAFVMLQYYDLPMSLYIVHRRTGDPYFQTLARKCADAWWKHPWIDEGRKRPWPDDVAPAPRHAGIGGLILRAIDGRPEMWDWINAYTRFALDHWLKEKLNSPVLFYGVREGAFALHYAAWLSQSLPDSFPNAAQMRAQYLADCELIAAQYFGRLQQADGSWRWDDGDEIDKVAAKLTSNAAAGATVLQVSPLLNPVVSGQIVELGNDRFTKTTQGALSGSATIVVEPLPVALSAGVDTYVHDGTLVGVMQPFMVGLLLCALIDLHRISTNETVKQNILSQITKACRHLYLDGPYMMQYVPGLNVKRRGFNYYFHGGTTTNVRKYVAGNYPTGWDATDPSGVQNARQAIGPVIAAFGYALKLTGDPFFASAGSELWDSAYGPTDGIHSYMEGDGKSFNQNVRRAGSYLVWSGTATNPLPQPSPEPTPAPTPVPAQPTASPSPDGTKATTITDSTGAVWTFGPQPDRLCLKNGEYVGGAGTIYKYVSPDVYVLGLDGNWYKRTATSWEPIGKTEPGVTQPAPTPQPTPTPEPVPTPAPCKMSVVSDLTLPSWGSGVITVTLENMTGPTEVKAVPSSGQIAISPGLKQVSGTSAIVPFQVSVKKKGGQIVFSSGCGSQTVTVNVK